MAERSRRGVEEILVEKQLLVADVVRELQLEANRVGRSVEDLIQERKLVEPRAFAQAKAEILAVPFTDLAGVDVPASVLNLVPQTLASRYVLIPFSKVNKTLRVAMKDPLDLQIASFLERRTGLKIEP